MLIKRESSRHLIVGHLLSTIATKSWRAFLLLIRWNAFTIRTEPDDCMNPNALSGLLSAPRSGACGEASKKNVIGTSRASEIRCSRPAPMRLTPFSYFWTCWNVTPILSASSVRDMKTLPIPQLKQQWRDLFETEPPPYNRRFLEHRLAYRIQELAYGGLKPETLEAAGSARPKNSTAAIRRTAAATIRTGRSPARG